MTNKVKVGELRSWVGHAMDDHNSFNWFEVVSIEGHLAYIRYLDDSQPGKWPKVSLGEQSRPLRKLELLLIGVERDK